VRGVREGWSTLLREGRVEAGWHLRQIYPDAPCTLYAGIHRPGAIPGLILEVAVREVVPGLVLPRSNGFTVEPSLVGSSSSGRARYILSLSDPAYEVVFGVLCGDVVEVAASADSPGDALERWINRLHVWQDFMARFGPGGLSEAAVLGLIGELLVLQEDLVPALGARAALDTWSGPHGEPNDFALPGGFLEVKATARQAPEVIEISNASQLDDSRGALLLVLLTFTRDPAGRTLPQFVSGLRDTFLSVAPDRVPGYERLLMAAGYVDAQAELYSTAYRLDRYDLFRVTEDFPRIRKPELMPGIRDCRYSIEIRTCRPWRAPRTAVSELLEGNHE
jgi:hypothetical protein